MASPQRYLFHLTSRRRCWSLVYSQDLGSRIRIPRIAQSFSPTLRKGDFLFKLRYHVGNSSCELREAEAQHR